MSRSLLAPYVRQIPVSFSTRTSKPPNKCNNIQYVADEKQVRINIEDEINAIKVYENLIESTKKVIMFVNKARNLVN